MEIESVAVHEEVLKEATVKYVRALKKRHEDRHLAIECRRKPKERAQDDGPRRSWPPPAEG
jgi:hypothetical protein